MTLLSPEQFRAVHSELSHTAVTAAAGSGKTRILVARFLYWTLQKNIPPENIIAITYTAKAAAEMRERLTREFRAVGAWDAADRVGQGAVNTIHGFCLKLLSENPVEAGIDPSVRVWDERESRMEARRAWRAAIEKKWSEAPAALEGLWGIAGGAALEKAAWSVYSGIRSRHWTPDRLWVADPALLGQRSDGDLIPGLRTFKELIAAFEAEYARRKREKSAIDFDDQMILAGRLLEHPSVFEWIGRRYQAILIDEFQDVNEAQYDWFCRLKQKMNAFVVGDVRQSIYGFRGSNCALLSGEYRSVEADPQGLAVELPRNYRSRPELVEWINRVFAPLEAAAGVGFGELTAGRSGAGTLPPGEVWVSAALKGERVRSVREREAARLAMKVRSMLDDPDCVLPDGVGSVRRVCPGDFAMLLRSRTAQAVYEAAFREAGIPYHTLKGKSFFAREEVRDVLNALRLILDPDDRAALFAALKSPIAAVNDETILALAEGLDPDTDCWSAFLGFAASEKGSAVLSQAQKENLRIFAANMTEWMSIAWTGGPYRLIRSIMEKTFLDAAVLSLCDGPRRLANLRKLEGFALRYEDKGGESVREFLDWVDSLIKERDADDEAEAVFAPDADSAVRILTIHASKGLEFPIILLPDIGPQIRSSKSDPIGVLESGELVGRIPGIDRKNAAFARSGFAEYIRERAVRESAEGSRLLYVAMTRATHAVITSGSVKPSSENPAPSWLGFVLESLGPEAVAAAEAHREGGDGSLRDAEIVTPGGVRLRLFGTEKPDLTSKDLPGRTADPSDLTDGEDANLVAYFAPRPPAEKGRILHRAVVTDLCGDTESEPPHIFSPTESGHGLRFFSPAFFGTLCHGILREVDFGVEPDLEARRITTRMSGQVDLGSLKRIEAMLSLFVHSEEAARIRLASRAGGIVYQELPLMIRIAADPGRQGWGFLKGQADLVYRTPEGEWTVVDYKSGSARRPSYEAQIRIYAWMIRVLFGANAVRGVLYSMDTGEWSEVDVANTASEAFESDLGSRFWSRV